MYSEHFKTSEGAEKVGKPELISPSLAQINVQLQLLKRFKSIQDESSHYVEVVGSDLTCSGLVIIAHQTSSSTIAKIEAQDLIADKSGDLRVVELVDGDLVFAQPAEILFTQRDVYGDTNLGMLFNNGTLLVNSPCTRFGESANKLLQHFLKK